MHVLVTGGSGFIGSALCRHLLADGHTATVLTRDPAVTARRLPEVRAIAQLSEADGIDAVVNLAGEPLTSGRWNAARKQAFRDSRLGTTQALVDWMRDAAPRPQALVSGSAIGYYGPRDDTPLDESAPAGDDFSARLCRDWEATARQAEALGVRTCLLRTGLVLDPDGGALARMLPAFRLGAGGPMGDGRQWMSWVARADLVRLIARLLADDAAQGAYNGTAPAPVRNREFAQTLAATLHRPAIVATPAFVLRLLFGEMSGLLLTGQRVLPERAVAGGFVFRHPALGQALAAMLG